MSIKAVTLAATAVLAFATSPAVAAVAWDGTGASDTVDFSQFGPEGSTVSSGTTFTSPGGVTGAVTTSADGALQRINQSSGWSGNFAPGAPLLWNLGSAGDVTFNFDQAVAAAGAQFQADFYGPFVARFTLNDGSFFDVNGDSTGNADNSAVFVGASSGAADISSVTFHELSGGGDNDFAVGNLRLLASPVAPGVPEPATWAMMLFGFGFVGSALRAKRRQKLAMSFA